MLTLIASELRASFSWCSHEHSHIGKLAMPLVHPVALQLATAGWAMTVASRHAITTTDTSFTIIDPMFAPTRLLAGSENINFKA
jgi:hypothetical protein